MPDQTSREEREPAHAQTTVPRGLLSTASAGERIAALRDIGLSAEDIAQALSVSANTIRSWGEDGVAPRRTAERALDDLRLVVLALLESGVGEAPIVMWLRSRNREFLEGARPLDSLREDPLMVIAAAEGLILGFSPPVSDTTVERRKAERRQPVAC